VAELCHRYGPREVLASVTFTVGRGELFGILGPNGGGKSTLFRILATLVAATRGEARVLGHDVRRAPAAVRRALGVVFQHASVDGKLTVAENLVHQGHLHGLRGRPLALRVDALLDRFGLGDRRDDLVERLSGGLARRVELAKGLLPAPAVLLLDEPTSGLDPVARREFMSHLRALRDAEDLTVVLTTHDLEEAERCDRLAILDRGRLVALDTPDALKAEVGGEVLVLRARRPEALAAELRGRFGLEARLVDGTLRVERPRAHALVPELAEAFADELEQITCGRPTLADVFVHRTGHRFAGAAEGA
jgi:ABC-2 type transport system ATP-binding protein